MARAKCRRYEREVGEQGADTMNSSVPAFISFSLSPSSDLAQQRNGHDSVAAKDLCDQVEPTPLICIVHLGWLPIDGILFQRVDMTYGSSISFPSPDHDLICSRALYQY
jgi:hypothetical protein